MKYSSTPTQKYDLLIQSYAWVWVLHIFQNHALIIIIMAWVCFWKIKNKICNAQNRRSGEIDNSLFEIYKTLSRHTESIRFKQHLTWQKYVRIHHENSHDHIENVFCIVMRNVHVLILQFQNQIIKIKILSPPYYFMSIKHCTLYCACQTTFKWKDTVSTIWGF